MNWLRKIAQKAPFEMTQKEFIAHREALINKFRELSSLHGGLPGSMDVPEVAEAFYAQQRWGDIDMGHRPAVMKALREGKQVPNEVLKDYPNLLPISRKRDSLGLAADQQESIEGFRKDRPKGFTTLMTPKEFLMLNTQLPNTNEFVTQHLDSGGKFAPPFITVELNDKGSFDVIGHEGRSRMTEMAKRFPNQMVQVDVFVRDPVLWRRVDSLPPELFDSYFNADVESGNDYQVPIRRVSVEDVRRLS